MLLISYMGLIVQFWRDNLPSWDDLAWMLAINRVLVNEEEGVPEVARFNPGQKFVFWSMALLVPVLFATGIVIWDVYFSPLHHDRGAAGRRADPLPGGDGGDHRLDHPCLCRDLGSRARCGR
ncbi:MAG: cytochrome b/b6 domain-containing protein [Acetobacteraceae bacterium]